MKKQNLEKSFFALYDENTIFNLWNESHTLIDLATKRGLPANQKLVRLDYEFIDKIKTRQNWKKINSHIKSRQRYKYVQQLSVFCL